jgi:hypothetical protein
LAIAGIDGVAKAPTMATPNIAVIPRKDNDLKIRRLRRHDPLRLFSDFNSARGDVAGLAARIAPRGL